MSRTRDLLEKKRNGCSVTVAGQPTTSRTQQLLAKKGISAGVDHTAPAPTHSIPGASRSGSAPARDWTASAVDAVIARMERDGAAHRDDERTRLMGYDVQSGEQQLPGVLAERDEAKKGLDTAKAAYDAAMKWPGTDTGQYKKQYEQAQALYDDVNNRAQNLRQDVSSAKYLQALAEYYKVTQEPEFKTYAEAGAAMGEQTDTTPGNTPGNIVRYYRDRGHPRYSEISDEEVTIYDYLLAKDRETGENKAQEYLEFMNQTWINREGLRKAAGIAGRDSWLGRALGYTGLALEAGLDRTMQGTVQYFSDDALPTSATQVASQQAQQDLDGFGRLLYSAAENVSAMGPSMALGMINPAVGAGSMFFSSGGNAYKDALDRGYSKEQARTYGNLVGAAEAGLQYALGGISSLGGITDDMLLARVGQIKNTFARVALTGAVHIGSEVTEEELQLFLEPLIASAVFDIPYDAPNAEEMIETMLVTAFSTGAISAPGMVNAALDGPVNENAASGMETAAKPRMSMEDFANSESSVWNNVAYDDHETQAQLMKEAHQQMVGDGKIVRVSEETLGKVSQGFPDVRSKPRAERNSILKQAINILKTDLRSVLKGLTERAIEFDVNGNVLEARLYSTGIREVLDNIGKAQADVLYTSEDIFKNAQYLYSTPDKSGNPNIYRWNYFYTPVQIGEDTVGVRIAVRDMVRGTDLKPESQIYHWGIKKDTSLDDGSRGPKVASSGVSSDVSIINTTIPHSADSVNSGAARSFGENGAQMVKQLAQIRGVDTERAGRDVWLAYQIGRRNLPGTELDLADTGQRMAYNAGKMDFLVENPDTKDLVTGQQEGYTDIKMEVSSDGAEKVHLRRGGQRNDGAHSSGSVRQLEESAGRDQNRQAEVRPEYDRSVEKVSYGRKVSTASFGIAGGSQNATISEVVGQDTPDMAKARKAAAERGLRVVFFGGNNLDITVRGADGKPVRASARGYISGDQIFVRVDHSKFTAEQIARHEIGHDMIDKGEINPDMVRKRIDDVFGPERAQQLADMYVEAYDGSQMTSEEIWKEVICDSLGDMNLFAGKSTEGDAARLLEQTKTAAQESKAEGRQTRGPPNATTGEHMSREADKFLRVFTGEVRTDEFISLTDVEYATIKSNIKSRDTFLSDRAESGLVWAHSAKKGYAYLFACNPDYSVTVTDVFDAAQDIAIINRITGRMKHYGRSGASIRRNSSTNGRTGNGSRGSDIGGGTHAQTSQSRSTQGVAKQTPAGNQRRSGTAGAQNSQNSGANNQAGVTGNNGNHFSIELPMEARINEAMTMAQARQMIQRAFVIGNIEEWYDGEYKNGDEWLRGEGAEDVAMIIDNEYSLQSAYLDKIQGILDGDFYTEDILEAYLAGTLTGKNAIKNTAKINLADSVAVADKRFYAPQAVERARLLYETADSRLTKANEAEVTAARAKVLLYAHNKGAAETLGLTEAELNRKLRSWSNYSAKARDISMRINSGVQVSNRWTGIENMSYVARAQVNAEDVTRMVKSVEGEGDSYQNSYIGRTMMALDTHIDWSWLTFKFDTYAGVNKNSSSKCNGYYLDSQRLIHVKKDAPNTVAHEMGHALDYQWARELGLHGALTEAYRNTKVVSGEARIWFDHFMEFKDSLVESSDIRSAYSGSIKETFARFVDKFVAWTEQLATGRNVTYDTSFYNDKFTGSQFVQFARLLQEKAALDANGQTLNKSFATDGAKHSDGVTGPDSTDVALTHSSDIRVDQEISSPAAQNAIFDALDHKDNGDDNLILLSQMPGTIRDVAGVDGDLYVYRNHLYENMVDEQRAQAEGRYNPKGHYHELGEEIMEQALTAINHPSIVIADEMKAGNPALTLILPVFDQHDWPIHAVLSFYDRAAINGKTEKRPHIAVTFYGHYYEDDGGRKTVVDLVNDAINGDRVLLLDKKVRADLPLIAERAPLGNVTVSALKENVAQFQKRVKQFKTTNKINYSIELEPAKIDQAAQKYRALIDEYGAMEPGENPAREAQVPKRTADNRKVSQTVRTILEAEATPDAAVPTIEEMVAKGDFSYESYGDREAMADAVQAIEDKGYSSALVDWTKAVQGGKVSKESTALGWALYNNAANAGDLKTAMTILTNMVEHQRNAAQALQATRILKKMSPEAQLYGVQRSAQNLAEELRRKYGKDAPDIQVNEELARKYLEAETDKEREKALCDLYRDLGRQMPSTFRDKWNAWRYLAMLFNTTTHGRNILGNAMFMPVVGVKSLTATGIEWAVEAVSHGKLDRTRGFVGTSKADRALLTAAWNDYANVADVISGGGKYGDLEHPNRKIQDGRRIFGRYEDAKTRGGRVLSKWVGRGVEWARVKNAQALDVEDVWFSKPHYAYALAQYCKANGISGDQLRAGKSIDTARAFAVKEAQKATYRDVNILSKAVSKMGGNVLVSGIQPFLRTPANILMRGIEYSPIGFLKGITWDLVQVKLGNKTGAEAIDNISAGFTGTGLVVLGWFLAASGVLRGFGGGDDDKDKMDELQGKQDYSLEIGNQSVTLGWLAPESIPLFIGVNLYESAQRNGDGSVTMADVFEAISGIGAPMLDMSCLQGLNSAIESARYADQSGLNALSAIALTAASNLAGQVVPTIGGKIERTGETERMTTHIQKNAFLTSDMQRFVGKVSQKVPGWDYQQIPYIDAWGRKEQTGPALSRLFNNFVNPSYVSALQTSSMEEELMRLYEMGEDNVFPSVADKWFMVDKKRRDLTPEEYIKFATKKGQTSYNILTSLVQTSAYKSWSDADKAECVRSVYEFANAYAKKSVIADYEPSSWTKKAMDVTRKTGIKPEKYILAYLAQVHVKEGLKNKWTGDTIANSESLLKMEAIFQIKGLTDSERTTLFETFDIGKSVIHYNKALVQQKLKEMRKSAA